MARRQPNTATSNILSERNNQKYGQTYIEGNEL